MRVASVAVLLLAVGHAMAEGQQSPPPVHIEEGACPFECCQYGRWMAGARVSLRAGPGSSEPIVGTIEVGDTVTAETGHVRSNPTAFVVRAPFEGFEAGDTVWVLSYLGEGYFNVWHEGALREAGLGFSPYGGSFGTRCAGCRHGEMVDELDATWWVRIRLGSGIVGWTSETDELYGKDACACL